MEFRIESETAQRDELLELGRWLEESGMKMRTDAAPAPVDAHGRQPQDVLVVLVAILGTKAVVEGVKKLVESIHVYIQASRPALSVTITAPNGSKLQLDLKNPQAAPDLTNQLLAMSGAVPAKNAVTE